MSSFAELFERLEVARSPEYQTVFAVAKRVRAWVEQVARNDDLCGYCAIASAELFHQLKKAGIDQLQLAMWLNEYDDAHVFLLWEDYVIDITATQFDRVSNIKDVEIRPLKEAMNTLPEWQPFHTFDSPAELRHDQLKNGWPDSQVAFAHEMM